MAREFREEQSQDGEDGNEDDDGRLTADEVCDGIADPLGKTGLIHHAAHRKTAAEEDQRAPFDAVHGFLPCQREFALLKVDGNQEEQEGAAHRCNGFREKAVIHLQDVGITAVGNGKKTRNDPENNGDEEGDQCVNLCAVPFTKLCDACLDKGICTFDAIDVCRKHM